MSETVLPRWVSLLGVLLTAAALPAREFADPAPPLVQDLPEAPPAEPQKNPQATFHKAPRPLPKGAVTHDWPGLLGPSHNLISTETKLLDRFPPGGPTLVWEATKGSGYAAPALAGDRVVILHRVGDEEVVDCLHRDTGDRFWRVAYPTTYRDRYGYNDGPRAAPFIAGRYVYTLGVEGKLHCLELATGRVAWRRDLNAEFKLRQNFFGCGTAPLVEGDKVIVNVGARGGPTVAAFDATTGKMAWGAGDVWGQSYASPVPAVLHGKRRVLVFAGGEGEEREKPTGGLMCLDPATGAVDFTFPWRGRRRESANASAPLVIGDDRVFVSECYGAGGAMLKVAPDLKSAEAVWTNEEFGTHFMVAIHRDGHLYGVDGHGPQDAFLVCVDAATGDERWRSQPEWRETVQPPGGGPAQQLTLGTFRSWLMPVGDGRVLCLGEFGHLLWVDLSPAGYKEVDRARLFLAQETWTPPVLSRGLLYVCQNGDDRLGGTGPRLLCYDLRAGDESNAKTPR
jgi:outer membrane protein assembly factor BamB